MALRFRGYLTGLAAAAIAACTSAPQIMAAFNDTRSLPFYNIHTKETVTIVFKKNGAFIPDGLTKANWILRDWRRNETTKMDPELLDLVWEIYHELGSKKPIHIISGYRSSKTNEMLRRTSGGQAKTSRHIVGKAMDVHFPDVPLKKLRYSALVRERGGVGYYPTSALPFVHIDTGRVRHWPRLPRYELALLFPDGGSKHVPADGRPINKKDVHVAQAKHGQLAVQIAQFHDYRTLAGRRATQVASAAAPARQRIAALAPPPTLTEVPQLLSAPRLVRRAGRGTQPTAAERNSLERLALAALQEPRLVTAPLPNSSLPRPQQAPKRLASLGGGIPASLFETAVDSPRAVRNPAGRPAAAGWSNGWAPAPAFDEEHPDELSYRPFPVAPLLTASAATNDPLLSRMTHPDAARTLDLLDSDDREPQLRFRPGRQVAQVLWAQQFAGPAVALGAMFGKNDAGPSADAGLARRRVRTQGG